MKRIDFIIMKILSNNSKLETKGLRAKKITVAVVFLMLISLDFVSILGQPFDVPRLDWRNQRLPRIELPPDPSKIRIVTERNGWSRIVGIRGAAGDHRARMVRIVNLSTTDRVAVPVRRDGSFEAKMFAPYGSSLQINTTMQRIEELGPELEEAFHRKGYITPSDLPHLEIFEWMIGGHLSSSPGIIIGVYPQKKSAVNNVHFVKKVGRDLWLFGNARASITNVSPGQFIDLDVMLSVAFGPKAENRRISGEPPVYHPQLYILFDKKGGQRSPMRQPVSSVLTPTGLPIETHGEMIAEQRPDGSKEWGLGGNGLPVPWRWNEPGHWQKTDGLNTIRQRLRIEIPHHTPLGIYQLRCNIMGIGQEGYESGEPISGPPIFSYLKVGNPSPPALSCLLLGSVSTGGSRGVVARQDRQHFAVNPKIVFMPEKLVIPRDDAYTKKPRTYPLDPYLPTLSMANRPPPVIPPPLIPFDFKRSRLTVTVKTPKGHVKKLGPARLSAGQNDLSVLRPDYVRPDRIIAPAPPTYGNPSPSDMYHLTGRGTFDYAFKEYGHHTVTLTGNIDDILGRTYSINSTYDIYVARPLDIDIFPEPGTPLKPAMALNPQVRILPAFAADVEIRFRHYPYSDKSRMVEQKITGTANRWGVFVPRLKEPHIIFEEPGEYICDVTARYVAPDGTLWMASRRGASVVITSDSEVVVHGERGNRSPNAKWRARWFMAGDGRFVAPPLYDEHPELPPNADPEQILNHIDLGHTCLPYESGDVAWLGHGMNFSLFPGITFEDPEGTISELIENRWPGVRQGAGREGLYPYELKPEDRRAIGEMPYVCMTESGMPPSIRPDDIDQWGYFYTTSWRPGVAVRSLVAEDLQPVGYWFFDDPYAYQFGNGPAGDLPGDVKMNYGGGVFRDKKSDVTHYGGYASMLVLIDGRDPLGARVLPPFDGIVPGSPPCGPLLSIGGEEYDVFLTFSAVAPGSVLETGDRLSIAGVVWPPVSGFVHGEVISPSGQHTKYKVKSDAMGLFEYDGPVATEAGVWTVSSEGVCNSETSVGMISELVAEDKWPRGGGIGLSDTTFSVPVVNKNTQPIAFDIPEDAKAKPPRPLVIRGHLPKTFQVDEVQAVVSSPGQVIDQQKLQVKNNTFEYIYDPQKIRQLFPNIDTMVGIPTGGFEENPAWYDTVTFTFWAESSDDITAGMVLLQGEELYAQASTRKQLPIAPRSGYSSIRHKVEKDILPSFGRKTTIRKAGAHSSLLVLVPSKNLLYAAHPWSGEIVKIVVQSSGLVVKERFNTNGHLASIAISPDHKLIYAALPDKSRVMTLDSATLKEVASFEVPGEPRAVLPSAYGKGLFIADFYKDQILRLEPESGKIVAKSSYINRPRCLASGQNGKEIYTASFRTGTIVVLNEHCQILRTLEAPSQLNQCNTITLASDGLLYAPQIRSDTDVGGRMFDRTVFPAIAVANPKGDTVKIGYFPDLLVVPPHRPVEVAVDTDTIYLASAGSDDVLAIDKNTGFAKWHTQQIGLEPGAIILDEKKRRLYVLTITGQEIIVLNANTGDVMHRTRFTNDPTPFFIARGRYLFGTATDKRLTKDQWISCAVCHPDGDEDGRQWDLGHGPLDTHSLRGCLETAPLHITGHLDEIQDTYRFTRMISAGLWFVPRDRMHDYFGKSNAGIDPDLDALAAYINTLKRKKPPQPPSEISETIKKGRDLFFNKQTDCARCHPPPYYTDSGRRDAQGNFLKHDVGTRLPSESIKHQKLDTPSLLGLSRSEPYLHDGRAKTLSEVLEKYNPQDRHGKTSHLDEKQIEALVEFLNYLEPPENARTTICSDTSN